MEGIREQAGADRDDALALQPALIGAGEEMLGEVDAQARKQSAAANARKKFVINRAGAMESVGVKGVPV